MQIKGWYDEIDNIPEKQSFNEITESLNELAKEKKSIGILKMKDRKEIQNKIEKKLAEKEEIQNQIKSKEDEIKSFIRDKENRLKQIENELSKER